MKKWGPRPDDEGCCAVCLKNFAVGDYTTLASIGPKGDDAEETQKYLLGQPYLAIAKEIHWNCAQIVKRGLMD